MPNATVAQNAGRGEFVFTVTLTDEDAKAIMVATPEVSITVADVAVKLYEMNPTHLVPGNFTVTLQSGLPAALKKNDTVTFTIL